jgi:hypothetical protein
MSRVEVVLLGLQVLVSRDEDLAIGHPAFFTDEKHLFARGAGSFEPVSPAPLLSAAFLHAREPGSGRYVAKNSLG